MALFKPDTLRSSNPEAFGIVLYEEIDGAPKYNKDTGKLDISTIPSIPIVNFYTVVNKNNLQSITPVTGESDLDVGDQALVTSEGKVYVLVSLPSSTLSNWIGISSGLDDWRPIYTVSSSGSETSIGPNPLKLKEGEGITLTNNSDGTVLIESAAGVTSGDNKNKLYILGAQKLDGRNSVTSYSNSELSVKGYSASTGLVLSLGSVDSSPRITNKSENLILESGSGETDYSKIELGNSGYIGVKTLNLSLECTTTVFGGVYIRSSDVSEQEGGYIVKTKGNMLYLRDSLGFTFNDGSENGDTTISEGRVRAPIGFFQTSDKRVKTNISPINSKNSDNIELIEFDRTDVNHHGYGVLAQEVEKYYPSIVNTDKNGFKSVDYIELLLIKTKRLEDKVKELEKKLSKKEINL